MKAVRPVTRRSVLARVVGGAIAGTTSLVLGGAAAGQERRFVVDADPRDPARLSVTDADQGAMADPPRFGRGGPEARRIHVVDSDTGETRDPRGHGRGPVHQGETRRPSAGGRISTTTTQPRTGGISDSDSGANADPAGRGRAPAAAATARGPTERFVSCPGHPRCPQRD